MMSISHEDGHLTYALCARIDLELQYSHSRRLYVIPTTPTTLNSIPRWLGSNARPHVVANTPQGLTTTQLLASLKTADRKEPVVALVFSDQLTSAADAPVLAEHSGRHLYLSALEIVAHCRYQLDVYAWTGHGLVRAPSHSDPAEILQLLHQYLVACDALGRQWLTRSLQADRFLENRISLAHFRLRMFHSAIMHAFTDSDIPPAHQHVVSRIIDMQKSLGALAST